MQKPNKRQRRDDSGPTTARALPPKHFPRKFGGKKRSRASSHQTTSPSNTANSASPGAHVVPHGPSIPAPAAPPPGLLTLPAEMFAEIMKYMLTPKDILNVARASKSLCARVVHKHFAHVFKHVRKHCVIGPIPDPTPNFREVAYASFIFDSGQCDVCQQHTGNSYASFALRLRLCSKPECRKGVTKKCLVLGDGVLAGENLSKIVPSIESDLCLQKHPSNPQNYPNAARWYRKKRYHAVRNEYMAVRNNPSLEDAFMEKHGTTISRFDRIMGMCTGLKRWSLLYQRQLAQTKIKNKALAQTHAAKLKIQTHELYNTKAYGDMIRHKIAQFEPVADEDWAKADEQEERNSEVAAVRKRKAVRDALAESEDLHVQAKLYWDKLQATGELGVIPTLYEFKHLRTVRSILRPKPVDPTHNTATTVVKVPLENRLSTEALFHSELRGWRTGTRKALYSLLGMKDEDAASELDQEPSERVTALFRCKACDGTLNGPLKDPLDFKRVCDHECPAADRARQGKSFFVANHFVKDEKAITAVTKVLRELGLEDGQDSSAQALSEVGTRVKCLSCVSAHPIIMHAKAVAGHSRRHENMWLEVFSEEVAREALAIYGDVDVGAVARAPETTLEALDSEATANTKTAKTKLRTVVAFGCRHCAGKAGTPRENDIVMAGSSAESDVEMGEVAEVEAQLTALERDGEVEPGEIVKNPYKRKKKTNRSKRSNVVWKHYHFDGVKAHLKTSHNVAVARDEDLYFDWAECARLGYAKPLPVESATVTA